MCLYDGCTKPDSATRRKGYCHKHYRFLIEGTDIDRDCEHCGELIGALSVHSNKKYCKDCVPTDNKKASYLIAQYGLTLNMFNAMYFEQDGKCARPSCVNEATSVDHSHNCQEGHSTKQACLKCIRGILCRGCNAMLFPLEDYMFRSTAEQYLAEYEVRG